MELLPTKDCPFVIPLSECKTSTPYPSLAPAVSASYPGALLASDFSSSSLSAAAAFAASFPLRLDGPELSKGSQSAAESGASPRDKPYSCGFCFKRFSTKTHKTVHERIHTGEKPFACRFCQKRFALRHHVTYHERTHTGEKPYACSICLKRFSQSSHLLYHKRIHASCAASATTKGPGRPGEESAGLALPLEDPEDGEFGGVALQEHLVRR